MFFFLSKFLPPFVYPLGLACILLGLALWLRRRDGLRAKIIIVALVVLWLGGNKLVAMSMVSSLEWQFAKAQPQAIQPAEVIVVLGGGTRSQAYPRPIAELNAAGNRLVYAAWLYKQGAAPRLLLSGGNVDLLGPASVSEAQSMTQLLSIMEIPMEALLLEDKSRNTYENAQETRAILSREGIDKIILITSATHMPRAYRIFSKAGFIVTPAPTDFVFTQNDWDFFTAPSPTTQLFNLIPTAENLSATTRALKEYIGTVIYWLRGWL